MHHTHAHVSTAHMEVETTPCHSSPAISFETGSFVSHIWRFSAVHLPVTEGLQTLPTVPGLMWSLGNQLSLHTHMARASKCFTRRRAISPAPASQVLSRKRQVNKRKASRSLFLSACHKCGITRDEKFPEKCPDKEEGLDA